MISLDKQYETRAGLPVVLLAKVDNENIYNIIGMAKDGKNWRELSWTLTGKFLISDEGDEHCDYDLVEVGNAPLVAPQGVQVAKFWPETAPELPEATEGSLQAWGRWMTPPVASL